MERPRPPFLTFVLVVSTLTLVFFPLFTIFYKYPEYSRLLRQFAADEATTMAGYLGSLLLDDGQSVQPGSLDRALLRRITAMAGDRQVLRLRIYSPSGVVVYSSAEDEIGTVNQNPYFQEILRSRRTVTVQIDRDEASLEGRRMGTELVEIYVPVVRQGRLAGIFELYYDITGPMRGLRRIVNISLAVQFSMAAVLLVAVLLSVGRASGYLADRERVLEELRTLSLSDELTGLYNRRGFFVLAEQQIKIAHRAQRRLLLASADLDGLKGINDQFGHHEGDRALADAAQILRETFRESDIIGRIGGDEFVVLMTDRPEAGAEALTRRLQDNVARHNGKVKRPYPFSISAGIVTVEPEQALSLAELLVKADQAMYAVKKSRARRA